jgi:alginate O-acetyltransferase complex protein AlgI
VLFTDPFFLFWFLPVLFAIYFAAPARYRNAVLTGASVLFYALGEPRFLAWMAGSIAVNYWIALGVEQTRGTPWARRLLILGITSDLALLAWFKYADWAAVNLNWMLQGLHLPSLQVPAIALPLGISFFTFHKISYKVDVYRHAGLVKRNPLDLTLYILLFPQLIAGPIVRYHEIADQLVRRTVSRAGFAGGVERFVIGLGKKMILANTLGGVADQIFAVSPHQLTSSVAWLGLVCYTLQIYLDFSGYSDMAIGLAAMFGFRFPENFDHPYVSLSVTEFWRRWHMSLSRWFRDYLYIPMGGNRKGSTRTVLNLLLVFTLCGLWHGAGSAFLLWGLYHGGLLILERGAGGKLLSRLPSPVRWGYTLLAVMGGWVFFRSATLPAAVQYLSTLAGLSPGDANLCRPGLYVDRWVATVLVVALVAATPIRPWLRSRMERLSTRLESPWRLGLEVGRSAFGMTALGGVLLLSVMLVAAGTYNPFIYFRF